MNMHDHLRKVFIDRLWKHDHAVRNHLLRIETGEELVELKRVALEAQHFEMASVVAGEQRRRETEKEATEILTNDAKRADSYTQAALAGVPPPPALDAIALELAKQMARQKDELIRKVARQRIGAAELDDLDLARRLKCYPPENREDGTLWSLDGKPLVMIWPPTVGSVEDGSAINRMQATFQYRIYP